METPPFTNPGNGVPSLPPGGVKMTDTFHFNFGTYWRTILKRWPVVLLITAGVLGGVFVWMYRQPKIYQGTCTIIIDSRAPPVLNGVKEVIELGTRSYWASREFYETQFRVIRSKEVGRKVVERNWGS